MGIKKVCIMLRSCTFPIHEWASRVLVKFSTNKTTNSLTPPKNWKTCCPDEFLYESGS